MAKKKLSRSIIALALTAAVALTGCDTGDPNPDPTVPGDQTTTTSIVDDVTTTSLADATTTTAP